MLKTGIELCDADSSIRRVRAGPHADRVDVARQHERRVAQRLAARDLQLVAAQHQRMAAELDDADLERDSRPGRRLLEDEADLAIGERARAVRSALELGRAVEQRLQLIGVQLRAGEEMSWRQGAGQLSPRQARGEPRARA